MTYVRVCHAIRTVKNCLKGRHTLAFNELNDDPNDRPAIVPPLQINKVKMSSRLNYDKLRLNWWYYFEILFHIPNINQNTS